MEATEWLAQITTDTTPEIAKKAGVSRRTLHHQITNGRLSVEFAVRIGAVYGHHPVETLIEWKVIDESWRETPNVEPLLSRIEEVLHLVPSETLADEVLRRMLSPAPEELFDTPVEEFAARTKHAGLHLITTDEEEQIRREAATRGLRAAQDKTEPLEEPENP